MQTSRGQAARWRRLRLCRHLCDRRRHLTSQPHGWRPRAPRCSWALCRVRGGLRLWPLSGQLWRPLLDLALHVVARTQAIPRGMRRRHLRRRTAALHQSLPARCQLRSSRQPPRRRLSLRLPSQRRRVSQTLQCSACCVAPRRLRPPAPPAHPLRHRCLHRMRPQRRAAAARVCLKYARRGCRQQSVHRARGTPAQMPMLRWQMRGTALQALLPRGKGL